MNRKSKKMLALCLVVSMILTQILFSNVAFAARLSGADRYQTALEVSKSWTTASTVVLALGEESPDALAAAPYAYKLDAPILLTMTASLPAGVLDRIKALGAKNVVIAGGVGAVSQSVEDALKAAGLTVERVSGADRYATSLEFAKKMGTVTSAVVVNGDAFADALSVASIAAMKGMPILLVQKDDASADIDAFLTGKTVYAIGGAGVIGEVFVTAGATRVAGADRYATNLEVIKKFAADLNFAKVYVATGESAADALAGSVVAAKAKAPVVLVYTGVAADTKAFLGTKVTSATEVVALGGTGVVSEAAMTEVKPAASTSLAVESVSAVNRNQLVVTFTQPVDETSAETATNYSLGGADLSVANDKFELSSDKKVLTINLSLIKDQYSKHIFKVKGNVITGDNASVVTVPSYTQELQFSDIAVPTMKSVSVKGNKKLTVTFSETVQMSIAGSFVANAGTKFKIDGQYLTNYGFSGATAVNLTGIAPEYANKIELNFATALPAGDHTLTVLAGVASGDLSDAAGFKVEEQTLSFNVAAVTNAPTVVSVEGQNNGTIYVTYDRAMGTSALTGANYAMNASATNMNLITGTFKSGSGDTIVKFTGVPAVSKGANVLTILKDTVADSYGNKLNKDNDTRVSFSAADDTTKPTVTSVVAITNTKVRVKFSESVANAYAINLNNYTLKNSSGETITLTVPPVAVGSLPSDTYDITTSALTGSNYTLRVKNIVDTASTPNTMDEYIATFNGNDDQAPTVTEAVMVSAQKVAVLFSEAMDAATITNTANFYYVDSATKTRALPGGTTITAGADNKSVEIKFPSSYTVMGAGATAEYNVIKIVSGNVKDAAGNMLLNISSTDTIKATGAGTVKPDYVAKTFKLTSSTGKVTAEFELNQNVTTLNKSDFRVVGKLADSAYISGKKIVLEFTDTATAGDMAAIKAAGVGATLTCVAQTSTNIYGTAINAFAAQTVYEDEIAPTVISIVAGANASQIKINFSEAVDQSINGLYKDDFTVESNGQVHTVSSVAAANSDAGVVNGAILLNLATPTAGAVTVKADVNKVDVKDLATDGAETANKYVPATADTDGTKGAIADTFGPVLLSVTFADGATVSANTFDADDTITFVFNEAVKATTIDAALTAGGSITGTGVALLAKMGTFATPMVLAPATDAATSTLALSADGKTVTITTVGMAGVPGTAPSGAFTPAALTDAATKVVTGAPVATGAF